MKRSEHQSKKQWIFPALLGVCFLLAVMAFSLGAKPAEAQAQAQAQAQTQTEPPVVKGLPVLSMVFKNKAFDMEVAMTPHDLQQGLMYRVGLGEYEGMIFPFSPARRVDFWMKNCLIPLDMVFMKDKRVVHVVHSATPCLKEPCPTYPSVHPVDMVLEFSAGTAKRLNVQLGDSLFFLPHGVNPPPRKIIDPAMIQFPSQNSPVDFPQGQVPLPEAVPEHY